MTFGNVVGQRFRFQPSSRWLLALCATSLFAGYLLALAICLHRQPGETGALAIGAMLVAPLCEIIVFYCVGRLLLAPGPLRDSWPRTLLYALNALVFTAVFVAQCYALVLSNAYISVLALENMEHARFTAGAVRTTVLVAGSVAWLGFVVLSWFGDVKRLRARGVVFNLLTGIAALGMVIVSNAHTSVAGGASRLQAGQSPVAALVLAGVGYLGEGPVEISSASGYPAYCGSPPGTGDFPFLKDFVNRSSLPFPASRPQPAPNVVVLFLEGTSARLLEAYGGQYPGLTPNISRMARQSMVVDNYFNHTAATFRGLQGQLTSGFPRYGGADHGDGWVEGHAEAYAKRSYSTLAGVLEGKGYRSVFFSPHKRSDALTRLIGMLGFDEIFTRERSSKQLLDDIQLPNRGSLTDHDQFQALMTYMQRHRDDPQPLFIGLYNIGTHAFLDVDKRGVSYGDGDNISLNTLHNLDVQFGRFYDAFMASDFADDTLLIVTADHAHYPGPPYVQAVGEAKDYAPFFIDRIPLLIHAPWLQLPARFDAHNRTSLDFTPTVLQLLGIEQVRNSFVGRSIFDARFNRELQLAPIGRSIYAIYRGRVYGPNDIPPAIRDAYAGCKALVGIYYAHEQRDAIFPRDDTKMTVLSQAVLRSPASGDRLHERTTKNATDP